MEQYAALLKIVFVFRAHAIISVTYSVWSCGIQVVLDAFVAMCAALCTLHAPDPLILFENRFSKLLIALYATISTSKSFNVHGFCEVLEQQGFNVSP